MGLILPRWGLILPRLPPPIPVLYSAVTNPFLGYVHTQNTPNPNPKHPFPGLNLKVGKMTYRLGSLDSNCAKCLKSGKTFLEVGKKFVHLELPRQSSDQALLASLCMRLGFRGNSLSCLASTAARH